MAETKHAVASARLWYTDCSHVKCHRAKHNDTLLLLLGGRGSLSKLQNGICGIDFLESLLSILFLNTYLPSAMFATGNHWQREGTQADDPEEARCLALRQEV